MKTENAIPAPFTRDAALALASAKWGDRAYAVLCPAGGVQLGARGIEYVIADTWRQACERIGLLEPER